MTQYLLALHAAGEFPDVPFEEWKQSFADCGAVIDKMKDAGAFVFAGGLLAGAATVVRQSGDDFLITDGPYAETKEHLAGFWIINAADLDVALEWAKLATAACRVPIEVSPFDERDIDTLIAAFPK
jgi:hypothetical protein